MDLALCAQRLPASLAALAAGRLTLAKLRVLIDHLGPLDEAPAAEVESAVLPRAESQTPGGLGVSLARAVLAVDPAAAERRGEAAVRERTVTLSPERDGMAGIYALLPAEEALRVYQALTNTANALVRDHVTPDAPAAADDAGHDDGGEVDGRTLDQRRADVLVDLVLDAPMAQHRARTRCSGHDTPAPGRPRWGSAPTTVHVTVAWTTLAGLDRQPAHLAGYGAITAETARDLAADATWRRILTDPKSGTVLDVGTTTYAPPAAMARHVRTRDGTCRFPGCRQPARRCDLDHVDPFPTGPTAVGNLAAQCRTHHRIKTFGGWTVSPRPDGTLTWTSPTRHSHDTAPPELPTPSFAIDRAWPRAA
ncbi:MAG: DUF222 domain-containing protein [Geodermatophilaceae bacterium]|nr:DUF222 domain-containing protein [Geodermatophilaceae bacterium]